MKVTISENAEELGCEAARLAGSRLRDAINQNGEARIILATGSSQFETLGALLKEDVDWHRVEIFHLDEYINLPVTHPASFRKYLIERFISHINCKAFHAVDTEVDIDNMLRFLSGKINEKAVDLGMIGIGVNGHIAFNDPPADFETEEPYIVVDLDRECRLQQVGEGWFGSLEEVPARAVSMSVRQIMKCGTIISAVPHSVKAEAVYRTFTSNVSPSVPATILKTHGDLNLFLDNNSASGVVKF